MAIEDVNEQLEELSDAIEELVRQKIITAEQAKKLGIELKKGKVRAEDFGKALGTGVEGLKKFTGQMASGNASFANTSTIVDTFGDALGSVVSWLPGAEGTVKALTAATTFAIDRIKVSYDAFQEVGRAGMLGAEGLDGLRDQMLDARIPMERLSKVMSQNAESMTYFSGTAIKGGNDFAKVLGSMQKGEDTRLRYLGFSIEEIGETVVNFQKRNRRLGLEQDLSTKQLQDRTAKYGAELDMVAKLTGKQRSTLEKERDALMADDQFRAMMNTIPGLTTEAANKMMDSLNTLGPEMRNGVKQIMASGAIIGEDAKKLGIQGMGNDILKLRERFRTGNLSVAEFMDELRKSADKNKMTFNQLAAITGKTVGARITELNDLAQKKTLSKEEREELKKLQEAQQNAPKALTEATVKAAIAVDNSQVKLDKLATSTGIAEFAIVNFTSAIDKITDVILDAVGDSPTKRSAPEIETSVRRAKLSLSDKNKELAGAKTANERNRLKAEIKKLEAEVKSNERALANAEIADLRKRLSFEIKERDEAIAASKSDSWWTKTFSGNVKKESNDVEKIKRAIEAKQSYAAIRETQQPLSNDVSELKKLQSKLIEDKKAKVVAAKNEDSRGGAKVTGAELGEVQALSSLLKEISNKLNELKKIKQNTQ